MRVEAVYTVAGIKLCLLEFIDYFQFPSQSFQILSQSCHQVSSKTSNFCQISNLIELIFFSWTKLINWITSIRILYWGLMKKNFIKLFISIRFIQCRSLRRVSKFPSKVSTPRNCFRRVFNYAAENRCGHLGILIGNRVVFSLRFFISCLLNCYWKFKFLLRLLNCFIMRTVRVRGFFVWRLLLPWKISWEKRERIQQLKSGIQSSSTALKYRFYDKQCGNSSGTTSIMWLNGKFFVKIVRH